MLTSVARFMEGAFVCACAREQAGCRGNSLRLWTARLDRDDDACKCIRRV